MLSGAAPSSALTVEPAWVMVVVAVTSLLLGGLVYYVKSEVQKGNKDAADVKEQLLPNHGSPSMLEQVRSIDEKQKKILEKQSEMEVAQERAERRHLNNEERILTLGREFLAHTSDLSQLKDMFTHYLLVQLGINPDDKENNDGQK